MVVVGVLAEGGVLWPTAGDWHLEPHRGEGETGEVRGGLLLAGRPGDHTPRTGFSGLLKRLARPGARIRGGGVSLGPETGEDCFLVCWEKQQMQI